MCDYAFYGSKGMKFNPFGPLDETLKGGHQIKELLNDRNINKVCAVDYVMDFDEWYMDFQKLLG